MLPGLAARCLGGLRRAHVGTTPNRAQNTLLDQPSDAARRQTGPEQLSGPHNPGRTGQLKVAHTARMMVGADILSVCVVLAPGLGRFMPTIRIGSRNDLGWLVTCEA